MNSVVHSHSPSVIPFGVTQQSLRPVFHMSGFLGEGSALFEIRDVAEDTDMLISSGPLGEALAAALGSHSTVLMRGHGSTVVGASVEQAVYRAIYAEVLGYGVSCDSHHMTAAHPQGDGAIRAMAMALKESGRTIHDAHPYGWLRRIRPDRA